MPSCAACDRYLSPATVRPDGTCPSCGRPVQVPERHAAGPGVGADAAPGAEDEVTRLPWHFKVAAGALALYLIWRFAEAIGWLVGRALP